MTLTLKDQIADRLGDIILEFLDNEEFTGSLLEEAMLEALDENASYFITRATRSYDLLATFRNLDFSDASDDTGTDCSSECDI
jgi:hypothetical protein